MLSAKDKSQPVDVVAVLDQAELQDPVPLLKGLGEGQAHGHEKVGLDGPADRRQHEIRRQSGVDLLKGARLGAVVDDGLQRRHPLMLVRQPDPVTTREVPHVVDELVRRLPGAQPDGLGEEPDELRRPRLLFVELLPAGVPHSGQPPFHDEFEELLTARGQPIERRFRTPEAPGDVVGAEVQEPLGHHQRLEIFQEPPQAG